MTTAADVLRYAADEVGYSRWDDALEGSKYGRWYAQQTHSAYFASSGVPFCAMFVSNILAEAGTSLLGNGQVYAYVPWMIRDARNVGRLVSPDDALPGDVLCFDWDGDGVADIPDSWRRRTLTMWQPLRATLLAVMAVRSLTVVASIAAPAIGTIFAPLSGPHTLAPVLPLPLPLTLFVPPTKTAHLLLTVG